MKETEQIEQMQMRKEKLTEVVIALIKLKS